MEISLFSDKKLESNRFIIVANPVKKDSSKFAPKQQNTQNLLTIGGIKSTPFAGRIGTFVENKTQLIERVNTKEMNEKYQEDLKNRANAFIDSIKERKAQEQRLHLALLFASPLIIKFMDDSPEKDE